MDNDYRQNVLVVDDEPAMIDCYRSLLSKNYRVHAETSGMDAIDAVSRKQDLDIVILDYRLPDLSGLEVLRELKVIKPVMPVILVTGYGDEAVAVDAFRYGAKDYMKKPICFQELTDKITHCLALKNIRLGEPRKAQFPAKKEVAVMNDKIHKAIKFIDKNFMLKISLDAVAKEACLSKYHFCRTFKQVMGLSFIAYITNRRIKRAQSMLRTSHLSIAEIALSVGYDDISHFIRCFKKTAGLTPSEFKKLYR